MQRQCINQKRLMEHKIQGLSHDVRNRGVVNAWDYYEKNRKLFRYPVYVPYIHSKVFLYYIRSLKMSNNIKYYLF